jgi:urease accessory protein
VVSAALLLLADGRLPAGGHAHSGGLEAAAAAGRVSDVDSLAAFLRGRLSTVGFVAAAFAAATAHRVAGGGAVVSDLDAALDARTASPANRRASRAQGRALLRAGRALWPDAALWRATAPRPPAPDLAPPRPPAPDLARPRPRVPDLAPPHHPVALGLVATAAGVDPAAAALVAAHGSVTGPAAAAVRVLGLDPYQVHAVLAGLAGMIDATAARAHARRAAEPDDLPAAGAPLLDISAEQHATWEVRLFAS